MSSDITIIISNHNYDRYVSGSIRSSMAQTVPCKIIVVDDASDDKSWAMIKRFSKYITGVRLRENSGGNARGKNVGIALSKTKYIACFDSDDMMTPHSIELRLKALTKSNAEFSFGFLSKTTYLGGYENWKAELQLLEVEKLSDELQKKIRRLTRSSKNDLTAGLSLIAGTSVLAKRSLYERFGLFDEELKWKIDKEMWYRWLSRGIRPVYAKKYIAIYRRHPQSASWLATRNDFSKKDPEFINSIYRRKIKIRKDITPKNTLMLDQYDHMKFVEEMWT